MPKVSDIVSLIHPLPLIGIACQVEQMDNNRINALPILEGKRQSRKRRLVEKERTELLSNAGCLFKRCSRSRFRRDSQ